MPKRTDIKSIMIIGSGPIVIGQACEFDYSGTQACKALREEGYKIILANSNPATIMTDPEIADRIYIEPLTCEALTSIIKKEKPDALLPTLGGQTALNLAIALHDSGVLAEHGVELIGASIAAIHKAEDRQSFKEAMEKLGLKVPASVTVNTLEQAVAAMDKVGIPAIIRPGFTMGGSGGGIAYTKEEYIELVQWGLSQSPVNQVLIEASVLGWKEYELEVMRDRADNVVIICSIENFDPMGVHTGDSITVAPAQTLTDKEYQKMRDAAKAIIREIGVDTGGSNIQFAVNPDDGELSVIEMNPRVSRSSALASKATGYPIAKIAAKLAVGYTLDELPNDITRETKAAFEPVIDYVVTKIPRFNFEKFPKSTDVLTTQMKSVGEVMALGRTFPESLNKALRSLEIGCSGLGDEEITGNNAEQTERMRKALSEPRPERLWWVAQAFRIGMTIEEVYDLSKIDPWFLRQIHLITDMEHSLRASGLDDTLLGRAKHMGFSDARIAELTGEKESSVKALRVKNNFLPRFRMVDTCSAEFAAYTPYLYSSYNGISTTHPLPDDECPPTNNRKVVILGSGPNRIGQGIEFDYCCVQAVFALQEENIEAIMVNCNPETVSTDYDTADRLYFEPLTFEDVSTILDREKPEGVIVQFGGQTPLKLARQLEEAGYKILGTAPDAIDRAEDRGRFRELIEKLNLLQPPSDMARSKEEAYAIAHKLGYPILMRPSYVLGGRAMMIVYNDKDLQKYLTEAVQASPDHPVLIDSFLDGAIEVDVDALCDGKSVEVVGVMQHIEEAGVHSGDSSCSLPPYSLSQKTIVEIKRQSVELAKELKVVGLINIQFAVQKELVYIIEVNPRASRTVPFVAKALGIPLSRIATKLIMGKKLAEALPELPETKFYSVKSPVFPFNKFTGSDTVLGPEMRSTGEAMGIDHTFAGAFFRAQMAAGNPLPRSGTVFVSVRDADKEAAIDLCKSLHLAGFSITATSGTAKYLQKFDVPVTEINKVADGSPHVVDSLRERKFAVMFNTTDDNPQVLADSYTIRRTALENGVPYFTTMAAAQQAANAITQTSADLLQQVTSIQEWNQILHSPK